MEEKKSEASLHTQLVVLLTSFTEGKKLPKWNYDPEAIEWFMKVVKNILSLKK